MRPLEIVFWAATVPLWLWCLSHRGVPGWARVVPVAALALMIAQIVIEGARWHMIPGYLGTVFLFLVGTWPRVLVLEPGPRTAVIGIGLMAAAVALGAAFPVFRLPKPTGRYPIGTATFHLVDPARADSRTDRPDGRRELMIQVWYPAERAGPGVPYRKSAETTFLSRHLSLAQTHAADRVPVAGGNRHPVILFSHSWGGTRADNVVHVEELASHGFVVVAIDHPYSSDRVLFPDGRAARTVLTDFLDYTTTETFAATEQTIEDQLRLRVTDARFVLDEIERLDRSDPSGLFTGRFDLSRVGAFGHSFGGAVSGELCRVDPRVVAGINLDGLMFGEALASGPGRPFLMFVDDTPVPTPADVANAKNDSVRRRHTYLIHNVGAIRRGLARVNGYYILMHGALHVDYCDSPFYSPFRRLRPINNTEAGTIGPGRATEIVNAYLLSFFRRHLKGEEDGLLDRTPPPYPEVEVQRPSLEEK